jgi:hypothetical protein
MMFVQQWPPLGLVMQSIAVLASTKRGCGTVITSRFFSPRISQDTWSMLMYKEWLRTGVTWERLGRLLQRDSH